MIIKSNPLILKGLEKAIKIGYNKPMAQIKTGMSILLLRRLLFEKERIGKVMEVLKKEGLPDPVAEPERALIHAQSLYQYGDLHQSLEVYTAIPSHPSYEPERLWGLACAQFRLGALGVAKRLLSKALAKKPPDWLLPRIYNTRLCLHLLEGNYEQAYRAYEKGVEVAAREPQLIARWLLEGNRGVLLTQQGHHEEAVLSLQRAVKQLQARDCILSTGHHLINLGVAFSSQGDLSESARCLLRAERLVQESGSKYRLIFLRLNQGNLWERMKLLEKAGQAYEEAAELLAEFPIPELEIWLGISQALLTFKKGHLSEALHLIRRIHHHIQEKGLPLHEDTVLVHEGCFLLRTGSIREGLDILSRAASLAESRKELGTLSTIALYQAFGHEQLGQREPALEWLGKCLSAVERSRSFQEVLDERETLVSLLHLLGDNLPLTDTLSTLLVKVRHPALVKRLLRRSPEGKLLFLCSLKVHEAGHFRSQLVKLRSDPDREVRRTCRMLLGNWQQHASCRVYTLGAFRAFLEGKMFTDKDWGRPGVKRLFLYFNAHPGEWQATEGLTETFWIKPRPANPVQGLRFLFFNLRQLFEPWHMPDMDHVFFQSQRGAYGFFPQDRFWMDWKVFEEGIKRAEVAHRARRFKEARQAYRQALDLYLGDYLEEYPYEDWLRPKRDYLRELYFRSVQRYAKLEQDSGNPLEARRVLEEALFKDLSRTGLVVPLIEVLSRMGLREEAKAWGERHAGYLKKELKEKPAPEVTAALARLK